MDTDILVKNQIDDGQRLLAHLVHNHFDVAGACWAKTSDEERWFLYIASKVVDEQGLSAAYRDAYGVLQAMETSWVSMFEVKLVSPNDPIAKDILEVQRFCTGGNPTRIRTPRLGNVAVEDVYVYLYPRSDNLRARPRIKWFAEREETWGSEKRIVREEIGEFTDFQSIDEQRRWKEFIDSKGGLEEFVLKYPRLSMQRVPEVVEENTSEKEKVSEVFSGGVGS